MVEKAQNTTAEIGQRIAARRKQLGWTQEQAAEKSGLSHQFFACVERGIKNIRAESVIKISRAMDVSTDYLLLGKSSEIDHGRLLDMMDPLSEVQFHCLEEIIKNFLIACGYTVSPERTDSSGSVFI